MLSNLQVFRFQSDLFPILASLAIEQDDDSLRSAVCANRESLRTHRRKLADEKKAVAADCSRSKGREYCKRLHPPAIRSNEQP